MTLKQTPLHARHLEEGARMVDFGGWHMPIRYGSQIDEHHAVRRDAGMFDVSHMTIVDLDGARVTDLLRRLVANDVGKLDRAGRALYTCMLTPAGGIIDDLIVYRRDGDSYRLIVNAATRERDLAWINEQAEGFAVDVIERPELAMIAVQGPNARARAAEALPSNVAAVAMELKRFSAGWVETKGDEWFVARTGYTGEDGFEIVVPSAEADPLWQGLRAAGVVPAGLGARDTLRLEAGLNLYGHDMTDATDPFESNLGWTVSMDDGRDFIGRTALLQRQGARERQLVGLVVPGRAIPREGQRVSTPAGEGVVTSGSFSPSLDAGIAMARLPANGDGAMNLDIRGKPVAATRVALPFVKNGKPTDEVRESLS